MADKALLEILSGREERALKQQELLQNGGFVCQIALNIPGIPKRIAGDSEILAVYENKLAELFCIKPQKRIFLENGAGIAVLLFFNGSKDSAYELKKQACLLEETALAGRIFDIDVITKDGSISRTELGLPRRRCIICGDDAKACAKEQKHDIRELRAAVERLIGSGMK